MKVEFDVASDSQAGVVELLCRQKYCLFCSFSRVFNWNTTRGNHWDAYNIAIGIGDHWFPRTKEDIEAYVARSQWNDSHHRKNAPWPRFTLILPIFTLLFPDLHPTKQVLLRCKPIFHSSVPKQFTPCSNNWGFISVILIAFAMRNEIIEYFKPLKFFPYTVRWHQRRFLDFMAIFTADHEHSGCVPLQITES